MAEKDIAENNLFSWNDIFADIVNVVFFNGECVVKENDLETESVRSVYTSGDTLHVQERDIAKYWNKNELRIALFGLENQSAVDSSMPMRVIGYDGAAYRGQLLKETTKESWHPVFTLVLYFGKVPWSKPLALSDCFEIDKRLRPFFSDYILHVLDVPRLSPDIIAKFKTEFRLIAEYFKSEADGTIFHPQNDLIRHAHAFLLLMNVLTGDHRFEESLEYIEYLKKDGGVHMCDVLDRIENKGIEIGEAKTQYSNVMFLMEHSGLTLDQSLITLNITYDEWDHFKIILGKKIDSYERMEK